MNQEISSLVDSELDEQQAGRAIKACCGSEELKQSWVAYHVIGEVLRGERAVRPASTARLFAALDKEPTVLAPRRRVGEGAVRVALAVAASVATVSVVAWIGLQGQPDAGPITVAKAPVGEATVLRPKGVPVAVNDYLTVHRQVPSPDAYLPVAELQRTGARR